MIAVVFAILSIRTNMFTLSGINQSGWASPMDAANLHFFCEKFWHMEDFFMIGVFVQPTGFLMFLVFFCEDLYVVLVDIISIIIIFHSV